MEVVVRHSFAQKLISWICLITFVSSSVVIPGQAHAATPLPPKSSSVFSSVRETVSNISKYFDSSSISSTCLTTLGVERGKMSSYRTAMQKLVTWSRNASTSPELSSDDQQVISCIPTFFAAMEVDFYQAYEKQCAFEQAQGLDIGIGEASTSIVLKHDFLQCQPVDRFINRIEPLTQRFFQIYQQIASKFSIESLHTQGLEQIDTSLTIDLLPPSKSTIPLAPASRAPLSIQIASFSLNDYIHKSAAIWTHYSLLSMVTKQIYQQHTPISKIFAWASHRYTAGGAGALQDISRLFGSLQGAKIPWMKDYPHLIDRNWMIQHRGYESLIEKPIDAHAAQQPLLEISYWDLAQNIHTLIQNLIDQRWVYRNEKNQAIMVTDQQVPLLPVIQNIAPMICGSCQQRIVDEVGQPTTMGPWLRSTITRLVQQAQLPSFAQILIFKNNQALEQSRAFAKAAGSFNRVCSDIRSKTQEISDTYTVEHKEELGMESMGFGDDGSYFFTKPNVNGAAEQHVRSLGKSALGHEIWDRFGQTWSQLTATRIGSLAIQSATLGEKLNLKSASSNFNDCIQGRGLIGSYTSQDLVQARHLAQGQLMLNVREALQRHLRYQSPIQEPQDEFQNLITHHMPAVLWYLMENPSIQVTSMILQGFRQQQIDVSWRHLFLVTLPTFILTYAQNVTMIGGLGGLSSRAFYSLLGGIGLLDAAQTLAHHHQAKNEHLQLRKSLTSYGNVQSQWMQALLNGAQSSQETMQQTWTRLTLNALFTGMVAMMGPRVRNAQKDLARTSPDLTQGGMTPRTYNQTTRLMDQRAIPRVPKFNKVDAMVKRSLREPVQIPTVESPFQGGKSPMKNLDVKRPPDWNGGPTNKPAAPTPRAPSGSPGSGPTQTLTRTRTTPQTNNGSVSFREITQRLEAKTPSQLREPTNAIRNLRNLEAQATAETRALFHPLRLFRTIDETISPEDNQIHTPQRYRPEPSRRTPDKNRKQPKTPSHPLQPNRKHTRNENSDLEESYKLLYPQEFESDWILIQEALNGSIESKHLEALERARKICDDKEINDERCKHIRQLLNKPRNPFGLGSNRDSGFAIQKKYNDSINGAGRFFALTKEEFITRLLSDSIQPDEILIVDEFPANFDETPIVAGAFSLSPVPPGSHAEELYLANKIPFAQLQIEKEAFQNLRSKNGSVIEFQFVNGQLSLNWSPSAKILQEAKNKSTRNIEQHPIDKIYQRITRLQDNEITVARYGIKTAQMNKALFLKNTAQNQGRDRDYELPENMAGVPFGFYFEYIQRAQVSRFDTLESLIRKRVNFIDGLESQSVVAETMKEIRNGIDTTSIPFDLMKSIYDGLIAAGVDLNKPIRIRSSNDLEDDLGAGVYQSVYFPGFDISKTFEQNLSSLDQAIRKVYQSLYTYKANNLRRRYNLDENQVGMALFIHQSIDDEVGNGITKLHMEYGNLFSKTFFYKGKALPTSPGNNDEYEILEINTSDGGEAEHIISNENLTFDFTDYQARLINEDLAQEIKYNFSGLYRELCPANSEYVYKLAIEWTAREVTQNGRTSYIPVILQIKKTPIKKREQNELFSNDVRPEIEKKYIQYTQKSNGTIWDSIFRNNWEIKSAVHGIINERSKENERNIVTYIAVEIDGEAKILTIPRAKHDGGLAWLRNTLTSAKAKEKIKDFKILDYGNMYVHANEYQDRYVIYDLNISSRNVFKNHSDLYVPKNFLAKVVLVRKLIQSILADNLIEIQDDATIKGLTIFEFYLQNETLTYSEVMNLSIDALAARIQEITDEDPRKKDKPNDPEDFDPQSGHPKPPVSPLRPTSTGTSNTTARDTNPTANLRNPLGYRNQTVRDIEYAIQPTQWLQHPDIPYIGDPLPYEDETDNPDESDFPEPMRRLRGLRNIRSIINDGLPIDVFAHPQSELPFNIGDDFDDEGLRKQIEELFKKALEKPHDLTPLEHAQRIILGVEIYDPYFDDSIKALLSGEFGRWWQKMAEEWLERVHKYTRQAPWIALYQYAIQQQILARIDQWKKQEMVDNDLIELLIKGDAQIFDNIRADSPPAKKGLRLAMQMIMGTATFQPQMMDTIRKLAHQNTREGLLAEIWLAVNFKDNPPITKDLISKIKNIVEITNQLVKTKTYVSELNKAWINKSMKSYVARKLKQNNVSEENIRTAIRELLVDDQSPEGNEPLLPVDDAYSYKRFYEVFGHYLTCTDPNILELALPLLGRTPRLMWYELTGNTNERSNDHDRNLDIAVEYLRHSARSYSSSESPNFLKTLDMNKRSSLDMVLDEIHFTNLYPSQQTEFLNIIDYLGSVSIEQREIMQDSFESYLEIYLFVPKIKTNNIMSSHQLRELIEVIFTNENTNETTEIVFVPESALPTETQIRSTIYNQIVSFRLNSILRKDYSLKIAFDGLIENGDINNNELYYILQVLIEIPSYFALNYLRQVIESKGHHILSNPMDFLANVLTTDKDLRKITRDEMVMKLNVAGMDTGILERTELSTFNPEHVKKIRFDFDSVYFSEEENQIYINIWDQNDHPLLMTFALDDAETNYVYLPYARPLQPDYIFSPKAAELIQNMLNEPGKELEANLALQHRKGIDPSVYEAAVKIWNEAGDVLKADKKRESRLLYRKVKIENPDRLASIISPIYVSNNGTEGMALSPNTFDYSKSPFYIPDGMFVTESTLSSVIDGLDITQNSVIFVYDTDDCASLNTDPIKIPDHYSNPYLVLTQNGFDMTSAHRIPIGNDKFVYFFFLSERHRTQDEIYVTVPAIKKTNGDRTKIDRFITDLDAKSPNEVQALKTFIETELRKSNRVLNTEIFYDVLYHMISVDPQGSKNDFRIYLEQTIGASSRSIFATGMSLFTSLSKEYRATQNDSGNVQVAEREDALAFMIKRHSYYQKIMDRFSTAWTPIFLNTLASLPKESRDRWLELLDEAEKNSAKGNKEGLGILDDQILYIIHLISKVPNEPARIKFLKKIIDGDAMDTYSPLDLAQYMLATKEYNVSSRYIESWETLGARITGLKKIRLSDKETLTITMTDENELSLTHSFPTQTFKDKLQYTQGAEMYTAGPADLRITMDGYILIRVMDEFDNLKIFKIQDPKFSKENAVAYMDRLKPELRERIDFLIHDAILKKKATISFPDYYIPIYVLATLGRDATLSLTFNEQEHKNRPMNIESNLITPNQAFNRWFNEKHNLPSDQIDPIVKGITSLFGNQENAVLDMRTEIMEILQKHKVKAASAPLYEFLEERFTCVLKMLSKFELEEFRNWMLEREHHSPAGIRNSPAQDFLTIFTVLGSLPDYEFNESRVLRTLSERYILQILRTKGENLQSPMSQIQVKELENILDERSTRLNPEQASRLVETMSKNSDEIESTSRMMVIDEDLKSGKAFSIVIPKNPSDHEFFQIDVDSISRLNNGKYLIPTSPFTTENGDVQFFLYGTMEGGRDYIVKLDHVIGTMVSAVQGQQYLFDYIHVNQEHYSLNVPIRKFNQIIRITPPDQLNKKIKVQDVQRNPKLRDLYLTQLLLSYFKNFLAFSSTQRRLFVWELPSAPISKDELRGQIERQKFLNELGLKGLAQNSQGIILGYTSMKAMFENQFENQDTRKPRHTIYVYDTARSIPITDRPNKDGFAIQPSDFVTYDQQDIIINGESYTFIFRRDFDPNSKQNTFPSSLAN